MADTEEQDDKKQAADPSAAVDDKGAETPESPNGDGVAEAGSPSAAAEKPVEPNPREELIRSLTGQKQDDEQTDAKSDADESADDETEADAKGGEPKAEDVDGEDDADEEDELEAPLPKGTAPKTIKRVQQLLEERKATKPLADYGANMLEFCKAANLTPEILQGWLALGADVNRDPKAGAAKLLEHAKNLAKKVGAELPVEREIGVPEDFVKDVQAFIEEGIANGDITAPAALKLQSKLFAAKTVRGAPPKAADPAPTPKTEQTPAANPQQAEDPDYGNAVQELRRLSNEYKAAMPADWEKVLAHARKELAELGDVPARAWPKLFKQQVELAKAKLLKPVPRPPATLRPTHTPAPAASKNPRSAIISELTGRG